jgi:hypothetical protein
MFKIGDQVKIIKRHPKNTTGWGGFRGESGIGEVCEIREIDEDYERDTPDYEGWGKYICYKKYEYVGGFRAEDIQHYPLRERMDYRKLIMKRNEKGKLQKRKS